MLRLKEFGLILSAVLTLACAVVARAQTENASQLERVYDAFYNPSDEARPGVYWFFLDANLSKYGMRADLDAMARAGLKRAIMMEANQGGPKGNVDYMTPEWLDCWADASQYAQKLGIEITSNVGPGWCGAGGPWIDPEHSMQHIRASETRVQGGKTVDVVLPVPTPRDPYFGRASLGPCENDWKTFYRDVAVVAYPTPKTDAKLPDWEEKALFYRPPYSSLPGVKPYLTPVTDSPTTVAALQDAVVPHDSILVISDKMDEDGRLKWDAPEGNWTILRLGRRLTGQTTRPAPTAGLGLESDKFERAGIERHFEAFDAKLIAVAKFTGLHHDSWEMSSQNWSEHFRELFIEKRGYDPITWTPAIFGVPVESVEATERFLWDLRRVAQELVYENNVMRMKELAAEQGLKFSSEVYDLNPAGDLYLFRAADIPMCEFWAKGYGFDSSFSVFEAVSSARVNGKPIVASESFTTHLDKWRQHPGVSKRQGDWAFCAGVNRFYFHRMCSQPNDDAPGLSLGPHGTHFDRTQTWFPLVDEYCSYLARVQAVLQRGRTSTDVLYLDQEQAPSVYEPPTSMFLPGEFKDKALYNFDGVCPQNIIDDASVKDGKIVFPSGAQYSALVLPRSNEMTIELAAKLRELVRSGARVIGNKPSRSPSLLEQGEGDEKLRAIVNEIWSDPNAPTVVPYPEITTVDSLAPIRSAKWIWSREDWNKIAPNVKRVFTKKFNVPQNLEPEEFKRITQEARIVATADNVYNAYINGELALSGNNFHAPDVGSIGKYLRPGENEVVIDVLNEGADPNPAGLIAALLIGEQIVATDASWSTCDALGNEQFALEIGAFDCSPWNVRLERPFDRNSTYPDAKYVLEELDRLGVKPDFKSATNSVRWLHKLDDALDFYFIANRTDEPIQERCEFRVTGKRAQVWNPMTRARYQVDQAEDNGEITAITIPFDPSQSWFVFFYNDDESAYAELPKLSEIPARNAAYREYLDLSRQWDVTFDQNAAARRDFERGKPKTVKFDALTDWALSNDEYVKHYSGLAVYEKTFDMPKDFDPNATNREFALELDDVQVMAKVELNGRDLGTLWLAPCRIVVPNDAIKPTGNRIKITVANLWCNRLIGDAALPQEERFTQTSNPMWAPGDGQLLPSGIIGAVKLMAR